MTERPNSEIVLRRLAAPIAIWAVTQILDRPKIRGVLRHVDAAALNQRDRARRKIARASRNVKSNPVWIAAGIGAIGVGIGLISRAARRK